MKISGRIISRLALAALISGVVLPTMAMEGKNIRPLEAGTSSYLSVHDVERFTVEVDVPTRLIVQPQVWAGTSPNTIALRAFLVDEAGNTVAESKSRGGLFHLDSRLEPGRYILVVSGRHLGGRPESSGHYRLRTHLEL